VVSTGSYLQLKVLNFLGYSPATKEQFLRSEKYQIHTQSNLQQKSNHLTRRLSLGVQLVIAVNLQSEQAYFS